MPVSGATVDKFIQLGIAGAALVVLLICIVLLFRFLADNKRSKNVSDINRIDKLCDKIDALITSNAEHTTKLNEVLLTNDKDQKTTIDLLDKILNLALDTQRRVVRIDDRTYSCIGNKNKKDNEEE